MIDITEQCNWNSLMTILSLEDDEKNNQKECIFSVINETLQDITNMKKIDILRVWYIRSKNINAKINVTYHKRILSANALSIRARQIYQQIICSCPTDDSILAIKRLIDGGQSTTKKVSGRTIDTLVTRFPRYHNVCYYLDVTDPNNTKIVPYSDSLDRTIILFDIGSSYRNKMHQYSKTYFDCFGRGDEVEHILSDGNIINMSLCQFTFFIWASRFKVFEFLKDEFERVIIVRQQSQKNTYKPKKRKRRKTKMNESVVPDLKKTVLCPRMMHGRSLSKHPERVVMHSYDHPQIIIESVRQMHSKPLCDYRKRQS
jgi:hypothetical protein